MLSSMLSEGRGKVGEGEGDENRSTEASRDAEKGQEEGGDEEAEKLEPWHKLLQRVTRRALEEMGGARVEDWADAVRKWIWGLAGHIARRNDGRWSTSLLDWPTAAAAAGESRVRHQLKSWQDDIEVMV